MLNDCPPQVPVAPSVDEKPPRARRARVPDPIIQPDERHLTGPTHFSNNFLIHEDHADHSDDLNFNHDDFPELKNKCDLINAVRTKTVKPTDEELEVLHVARSRT